MAEPEDNQALREEFNRWAVAGRGEEMEEDHLPITLPVLDLMQLSSEDNVLDVGCGAGEGTASRWRTRCSSSAAWTKFPGTRISSHERFRSSRLTTGRIRRAA